MSVGTYCGKGIVIVAETDELAPLLSIAVNVTVVDPLGNNILAFNPEATLDPATLHSVDTIVPSLSLAVAVRLTDSPALSSVSAILRLPPTIDTVGDTFVWY